MNEEKYIQHMNVSFEIQAEKYLFCKKSPNLFNAFNVIAMQLARIING